jgi:hypothetical protein
MTTTSKPLSPRSIPRRVLGFVGRCLFVLVVIEGAASLLWLALSLPESLRPPLAERLHTRYDPELGWVNTPGTRIDDFYGPGADLTINSQGFRSRHEFSNQVPAGRMRVVCAGDSFTLGYGVGDRETWCAQLEALDPRIESLNMGQGGYGVDQAYLWYARDSPPFDHQVLLFAFIREDFARMQSETFLHYGKPILRLDRSGLRADNVPVPRGAYRAPWIVRNARIVEDLRAAQLLRPAIEAILPKEDARLPVTELSELTSAVFQSLDRITRERDNQLVLVYLPMRRDYASQRDPWRRNVRREARVQGIPLIDLVDAARRLPTRRFQALFIPDGSVDYLGADGHYNAAGNQWVAQQILAHLEALPGVSGSLAALPSDRQAP